MNTKIGWPDEFGKIRLTDEPFGVARFAKCGRVYIPIEAIPDCIKNGWRVDEHNEHVAIVSRQ